MRRKAFFVHVSEEKRIQNVFHKKILYFSAASKEFGCAQIFFGHILGTFSGCPAALLLCQFEKVDQVSNQTKFVNFGFSLADQSGYSLPFS